MPYFFFLLLPLSGVEYSSRMSLHDNLRLYIAQGSYSIVAKSEKLETLHIDRSNGSVSVLPTDNVPAAFEKELVVYGVFGIISLLKSDYLIVITGRSQVTTVLSTPVYAATSFSVFPIERSTTASLLAHPDEAYLLGLLKSHIYSAPFYFTYGSYNVTNKLQSQRNGSLPFWETSDDRFFWNRHLQTRLIEASTGPQSQDCRRFILPVMFGFLNIKFATINGRDVLFGLISRRNRFRAGTRYFSRGVDRDGNVSNFNETEQVLLLDPPAGESQAGPVRGDIKFSYVQTRGSVPVYWAEINNLRYKPDLKIMDLSSTAESLTRHFDQQVAIYGDQYIVNLVNKAGYEKPVKEAYERALDAMANPRVHYTYFDFHHECKGLRFDRVSVLIDSLDEELHQQGYFFHDSTTSPSRPQLTQTSVVRTNCMDCLDRTNVVQSALGKWVLNNQLRQVGVLSVKESIDDHPAFLHLFRNIWADNADVVSRAYSGTGALKTDYTRTGKRSKEGALQDGVNSVIRYIKNNFLDGPRQDAYDLVTGSWIPRKGQEHGWRDERGTLTRMAPLVLLFALALLSIALFSPPGLARYLPSSRKLILVSVLVAAVAFVFITNNGIDYVAWPRLVVLDDTLNYAGKGFESGRRGRPVRVRSVEGAAKRGAAKKERKDSLLPTLQAGAKRD